MMQYTKPCNKQRLVLSVVVMLLTALAVIVGWRWYWQPVAEINPRHWANNVIMYSQDSTAQTLWLHRRHAAKLNLTQTYELIADGKTIAVRFTAISYPTLYPTAIRVDFELTNTADKAFILHQKNALLQRRQ